MLETQEIISKRINRNCVVCGKIFETYKNYSNRGPRHTLYCSKSCAATGPHNSRAKIAGIPKQQIWNILQAWKLKGNLRLVAKTLGVGRSTLKRQLEKNFPTEYMEIAKVNSQRKLKNTTKSGTRFEWRVRKIISHKDFFVFRSAGSKTIVDLIAFKKNRILLIQCRANSQYTKEELSQLHALAEMIDAVPLFVWRNDSPKYEIIFHEVQLDESGVPHLGKVREGVV